MQGNYKHQNTLIADLKQNLEELRLERNRLAREVSTQKLEVASLRSEVSSLKQRLDRWKRERQGEKDLNNQLVDSVEKIRDDFKNIQRKNRELQHEKSQQSEKMISIMRELRDERDLSESLRNDILSIKTAKHTGGIENMKLVQDIEHMKRVNAKLRKEKEEALQQVSFMLNTHKSWVENVERFEGVQNDIDLARRKWEKSVKEAQEVRIKQSAVILPEPAALLEERLEMKEIATEKQKQRDVRARALKQRMERKKDDARATREQQELKNEKLKSDFNRERQAFQFILSDFQREIDSQKEVYERMKAAVGKDEVIGDNDLARALQRVREGKPDKKQIQVAIDNRSPKPSDMQKSESESKKDTTANQQSVAHVTGIEVANHELLNSQRMTPESSPESEIEMEADAVQEIERPVEMKINHRIVESGMTNSSDFPPIPYAIHKSPQPSIQVIETSHPKEATKVTLQASMDFRSEPSSLIGIETMADTQQQLGRELNAIDSEIQAALFAAAQLQEFYPE